MANTTYSVPVTPVDRLAEVMCAVANHMQAWNQAHNAALVSIVRNGANVDFTFSNPLPAAELRAIRAVVT